MSNDTSEMFSGVLPFTAMECVILPNLVVIPRVSTWLPQAMM